MRPEDLRRLVAAELADVGVVVALGGGADSAMAAWCCVGHPGARAIFVDHRLAGSPRLRASAEALAASVGLPFTVLSVPVEDGPNLEDRARTARWQAIRADLTGDEVVVTGHSRDDLGESMLMNLLRGAGSAGLAAMAAVRDDIRRPLLGQSRSALRDMAGALDLPFTDDPANEELRHLRNRVRAELVPLLERDYQQGVRENLARAGSNLAADDAQLESAADAIPLREDEGAVLIPIPLLGTTPRPVAARAVRRALRLVNPPYAGSSSDIDSVMAVATGELASVTIGGGLTAAYEPPYVAIWSSAPAIPRPVTLETPGAVTFGRRRITATRVTPGPLGPRSTLLLDPSALEGGVTVRGASDGERIDIDAGTKLVRDALAEARVPPRVRAVWPVLAVGAKIAAIVAVRAAPWARPAGDLAVAVAQEQL
jgi:tRNA(Ile)-lysidine synthase